MRTPILFLLLVVTGCGGVRVPEPPNASTTPPLALSRVLALHSNGLGWASPITPSTVLTAAHMVGAPDAYVQTQAGERRHVSVLWQDDESDIAMMRLDNDLDEPFIPICNKPPAVGAFLYWRILLHPGLVPSWTMGRVLGIDGEGNVQVDGYVAPGASGGGAITADGKLCGVVTAGWFTSGDTLDGKTLEQAVELLRGRSSFRPVVAVTLVAGKFPERGKK